MSEEDAKARRRARYRVNREVILRQNGRWAKANRQKIRDWNREYYKNNPKVRERVAKWREKNGERIRKYKRGRDEKLRDLVMVLRKEMPELLKEFGL